MRKSGCLSGGFLGRGHYSPNSRIRVRLLESCESAPVGEGWWRDRLLEAVGRRRELLADPVMDWDRDPVSSSYLRHVYESREGARGGAGGAGGGCGCN